MEMTLTTPAVFFPAVSLLLLAYTNRFLALASVIRKLHSDYKVSKDPSFLGQIANLRWRIRLVRNMQFCGVSSLLLCTICMFLLFLNLVFEAEFAFCMAMLFMIASMIISLIEIQTSVHALDLHLKSIEEPEGRNSAPS